jgi:hypothetical protein
VHHLVVIVVDAGVIEHVKDLEGRLIARVPCDEAYVLPGRTSGEQTLQRGTNVRERCIGLSP